MFGEMLYFIDKINYFLSITCISKIIIVSRI